MKQLLTFVLFVIVSLSASAQKRIDYEYLPSDEGCHQQGEYPYNHPLIVERQVRRPPSSYTYGYHAKNESCDAGYYRYVFPHIIRCKSVRVLNNVYIHHFYVVYPLYAT